MTLVKAKAMAKAKVKHIYGTGIIYDRHLQLTKYHYSTGHWSYSKGRLHLAQKYSTRVEVTGRIKCSSLQYFSILG